ncbi:MAG: sigma-70 family RNA polymerase sigma factor [Planctomycetes bacterium]|nr:sigma-70 family RNA polymerase sigma factor [Planctomycetota bacterium]MCB9890449.1 sigma-70 family RNA polymerase sigma factor [Planctomycetota bacterium]MCB9917690.1 sigma-70 family RNA polymerase sigma factor [Planctomycetota bacterium]
MSWILDPRVPSISVSRTFGALRGTVAIERVRWDHRLVADWDEGSKLVREASRGDERSVTELLARHLPRLRAFLRLRLSDRALAKDSVSDFVQSVCRECLVEADAFEYRSEAAFRHWLFTLALRKVQDRARYWHAQRRSVDREQSLSASSISSDASIEERIGTLFTPSRDAAVHEEIERVHAAFEELPEHYRELLTMSRIYGYTNREIAELMGRGEDAVRMMLARALVKLSSILSD